MPVSVHKMCFKSVLCNPISPLVVHVSAHLVNVVNFSVSYSDEFPALNLARYRGEVRHKHTYTSSKNVLTLKQSPANVMCWNKACRLFSFNSK